MTTFQLPIGAQFTQVMSGVTHTLTIIEHVKDNVYVPEYYRLTCNPPLRHPGETLNEVGRSYNDLMNRKNIKPL